MPRLDDISDDQIDHYLKKYKLYRGSFDCLELSKMKIRKGIYIVNIDRDPNGNGTHWTMVCNLEPKRIIYFDPFGQVPNTETLDFMEKANKPMFFNTTDYQAINGKSCGYFNIFLAIQLFKRKPYEQAIKVFSNSVSENEKILYDYFK